MIATCAIIVNSKREILFIKRGRQPFKGRWALISGIGATEKGMAPQEAISDEVAFDLQTTFEGKEIFRMPIVDDQKVTEIIVFKGIVDQRMIKIHPPFTDAYQWITPSMIDTLGPLAFEHDLIISHYLKSEPSYI
jgi:ADP-ribose pyrophosphatase YjhB (NUDIX family)